MSQSENTRISQIYDQFAPTYDRGMPLADRLLFGGGREWLCTRASGDVLEIAIGTGRNIPLYRPGIRLTGLDLSLNMLAIARHRADEHGVAVNLLRGDAQALPIPDATFDSVVICLALCTIPDERRAINEAIRVLRPGGRLLWMEHIGSNVAPVRLVQRMLEPSSLRRFSDHLLRQPSQHLRQTGMIVEERQLLRLGAVERLSARKPGSSSDATAG